MSKELQGDYRKFMDKNYLGAWDVPEGEDLILTIDHAEQNEVQNKQGKDMKLTIHFKEDKKPMILNKTNSDSISKAVGSKRVEKWKGQRISIYVANVSAFGGTTDALRVRDYAPKVERAVCADCGKEIKAMDGFSVNQIIIRSRELYNADLCMDCAKKRKEAESE